MIAIRAGIDFDNEMGMGLPDGSISELYVGDPFADHEIDVAMLLEEAVRVLKPNGLLCFDYIAPISREYLEEAFKGLMKATVIVQDEKSDKAQVSYSKLEKGYTDGSWNGSKSRFSVEELSRSVPRAVAKWARSQGDLTKENLKLPYKEPDGTINLNGARAALAAIHGARNKPDLPANVLSAAASELESAISRAEKSLKKSSTAFFKASGEEQIVYFSVLSPWKLDMDGHYFTPEAIANACGKFDKIRNNIDINHSFEFLDGVEVIDNFIATGDEDFKDADGEMVKMTPGEWILGLHMVDDDLWEGVKNGTYSGVSLAGQGLMVEGSFEEVVLNG